MLYMYIYKNTSYLPYIFLAWCLIMDKDNFTIHLCALMYIELIMSGIRWSLLIFCLNVICFYIFLLQLADIKRLLPRLKSMSFKLQFSEMVQDIKPVSILVLPCPWYVIQNWMVGLGTWYWGHVKAYWCRFLMSYGEFEIKVVFLH